MQVHLGTPTREHGEAVLIDDLDAHALRRVVDQQAVDQLLELFFSSTNIADNLLMLGIGPNGSTPWFAVFSGRVRASTKPPCRSR